MKKWHTSKTLWLNASIAALATLEGTTGALQPLLPFNVYQFVAFVLPIANAMLRVVTIKPICRSL